MHAWNVHGRQVVGDAIGFEAGVNHLLTIFDANAGSRRRPRA
jgi:hypothetical protein